MLKFFFQQTTNVAKSTSQSNLRAKSQVNSNNKSSANFSNNTNATNVNVNGNDNNNKGCNSLLGRPRTFQPGAGLMGASPQSAIISPTTFIRRNGSGTGLLPLPLPGKMNGLMVAGSPVNFSCRVNRSNLGSKSKGRKPTRPARCISKDNHDSTTESDEPASAGKNHKKTNQNKTKQSKTNQIITKQFFVF